MDHTVSLTDTLINIVFQWVNIAIFFFLFIKFAGKNLTDAIAYKIEKEKRLADADNEYLRLIAEAELKKEQLIEEALSHKKQILSEAKKFAEQEKNNLIEEASRQAKLIVDKASKDIEIQKNDLSKGFEQGVKSTATSLVKKLFADNKKISDAYLSELVDEFTTSYKSWWIYQN